MDVARRQLRSESAKQVRDIAGKRGVDISTTPRQSAFVKGLQVEQSLGVVSDRRDRPLDLIDAIENPEKYIPQKQPETRIEKAKKFTGSLLFGDVGKKFTGIGNNLVGFSSAKPLFTFEDINKELRTYGTTGEVVSEFIPETPVGTAATIGTFTLFPKLPKAARITGGAFISEEGTRTALNPDLPKSKRIAGGIIGGLAATGTFFETLPYIRGFKNRLSEDFLPVKTQKEGFKAIELPDEKLGLIEPGSPLRQGITTEVQLPKTSPLKRGGFEVKPSEKSLFLGEQTVATSQQSFFKPGRDIILEREFFVSPQDPFAKIPETRVSRLGLSKLFEIPKDVKISFGIPKKPQIGIKEKAMVGFSESEFGFKIGRGTELEAIKSFGRIQNVERIGRTSIRGQGIDIFKFDLGVGSGKGKVSLSNFIKEPSSSLGTERISGESLLSVFSFVRGRTSRTKKTKTSRLNSFSVPTTLKPTTTKTLKPSSFFLPPTSFKTSRKTKANRYLNEPLTTITPSTRKSSSRSSPLIRPITPPIFSLPRGKKPKKKTKTKGYEDIGISEGFTAKVLGLKPVKVSKKQIRKMGDTPFAIFGIRRKPVLINEKELSFNNIFPKKRRRKNRRR